jgi:hypothetical protein
VSKSLLRGILTSLALLLGSSGMTQARAATACQQRCLKGFMDAYLNALAHHDPAAVPVAAHYRYTENGAAIKLGEALWVTFGSFGKYRHDFYDPSTGGVASYVSLTESGHPDLLAVRLKVAHGKIDQIETVVVRNDRAAVNLPPRDPSWMHLFTRVEPKATRLTRAQLIQGALGYMRAVAFHNGSLAPFAKSCMRLENGMVTVLGPHEKPPVPMVFRRPKVPYPKGSNPPWFAAVAKTMRMGCGPQLNTKVYSFITGFEDARFPVVDVRRQIVFGIFDFMRRGNIKTVTIDGTTYDMMANTLYPNEILNTEAWKFVDGKIARVEAVFEGPQAYMLGTGWPGGTPAESRPIGQ